MGISSSMPMKEEMNESSNDISNLPEQIDDIAVGYILTQNTIDLIRLGDKEYYDNMIILTSSILNKRLSKLELGFLNQRITNGIQEPIYAQDKHDITNLIPKNDAMKNKMLHNISKYYMKIITIYSAIVATMDPQYFYEDEDGNRKTFYLKDFNEYKNIPHNAKPRISQITNPLNLCRKRLNILKNKLNIDGDNVTINPGEKLCSLDEPTKRLNEEIGIKELDLLYYDIFDSTEKKWAKMSNKMKKKYNKDLTLFYQIFTGKKNKPSEIKSFHDIEMLDFKTFDHCNKNNFIKDITVSKNNKLIQKYLDKIYIIQQHTNTTKEKLMYILKKIFISDNNQYKINPELTLDKVFSLENDTREVILHLYTTCEKYFVQALLIFEKIFEENVHSLNIERDTNMKNTFVIPTTGISITPDSITPNSITPNSITPNSITTNSITPNSITPNSITPNSITPKNNSVNQSVSEKIQSSIMDTFGFGKTTEKEGNQTEDLVKKTTNIIEPNSTEASPTNSPTNAIEVPPTNAIEVPPTNAIEVPPTNAIEVPPTNSPTNAIEVPPTNAIEVPPTNAPTNAIEVPPTNSIEVPPTNSIEVPPTNGEIKSQEII